MDNTVEKNSDRIGKISELQQKVTKGLTAKLSLFLTPKIKQNGGILISVLLMFYLVANNYNPTLGYMRG